MVNHVNHVAAWIKADTGEHLLLAVSPITVMNKKNLIHKVNTKVCESQSKKKLEYVTSNNVLRCVDALYGNCSESHGAKDYRNINILGVNYAKPPAALN